jgi:dipeptidyl aminopeptidase/acylaminoacyl peptidase
MDGFSGLSWSPDGSKIAVSLEQPEVFSSDLATAGALIVSVQKSTVRALVGPSNYRPDPSGRSRFVAATVWNVQSGAPVATIALPLPAAERYQWSTDGTITPVSASVAPSSATPMGSAQFSYWQPGFVAAVPTNPQSVGYPVWLYSAATFTRWSPDSRYVAPALMTMNRAGLSTEAPTSIQPPMCQDAFWPQPCNDQPIPSPDAAFRVVLARVETTAKSVKLYPNDAPVAWSPDGAVLATVLPGDDGSGMNRVLTLTLIDSAAGTTLGTATLPIGASQGNIGMTRWPYMSWAPNGKQLAVVMSMDNDVEVVSIAR